MHLPKMLDFLYSDKSKKQNNKLHSYLDRALCHSTTGCHTSSVPVSTFSIREGVQSRIFFLQLEWSEFAVYRNQESDHACSWLSTLNICSDIIILQIQFKMCVWLHTIMIGSIHLVENIRYIKENEIHLSNYSLSLWESHN